MLSPRLDVVLNLREARRKRGLTQREAAKLCGVHEKTISSFETGVRVSSLKVSQLIKLLRAYAITPAEFFTWSPEDELERPDSVATNASCPATLDRGGER